MTDALARLRAALAGRYRIEREIGAGGMATVYLAHDERHDRRVALKVMRPELAAAVGAERFLREIKVTAALQHPHILPLFDSGEVPADAGSERDDATSLVYFVMPFVEGETLRARLDRLKQLPLREAIAIARAIASALDHAHRRGIVHRDIKPENILLAGEASDGVSGMQALVADFGVAVAIEAAGTGRLTSTGIAVGTPMYMSPEQASAERNLGPASDIYSLGAMLYEMLAGEPPFTGPTPQAVVARIVADTPVSVRVRRPTVSPQVEAAVMRALAKSPADRQASAALFADDLETGEFRFASSDPRVTAIRGRIGRYFPWGLVAAGVIAIGALVVRDRTRSRAVVTPGSGGGATHFAIALPDSTTARDWHLGVATSPDGDVIAFVATNPQGQDQIYVKRLDESNVNPLAGTVGARDPFFSPDGRTLGFSTVAGQLKAIALASGSVTLIADSIAAISRTRWTDDGCILIGGRGIRCISVNGTWTTLTRVDTARGEQIHFAAQVLPGSRTLLFSVHGVDSSGAYFRVMVQPDRASAPRVLVDGAVLAEYLGDGRLVYQKQSDLFVANLDIRSFTVNGERRVLSGVAPMSRVAFGTPWSISHDMLVYGSAEGLARSLVWVDRNGGRRRVAVAPRSFFGVAISPDGRRAMTTAIENGRLDVWAYDFDQEVITQVTRDGLSFGPIWGPTPDLITVVRGGKTFTIATRPADGSGTASPLLTTAKPIWPANWTRDGRSLVLMDAGDITRLDLENTTIRHPIVNTPANEFGGRLSPDERWVAYFSAAGEHQELYVTRFPDGGQTWRVSRGGAREAVWSRDGKELFYRSENGRQLLSVSVTPGKDFVAGGPTVLFGGNFFQLGGPGAVSFDVSPDGKRFLMLEPTGTESGHLNVILGWDRSR